MTDLVCPNCGSDHRSVIKNHWVRRTRSPQSTMGLRYVCLKCGFHYRDNFVPYYSV